MIKNTYRIQIILVIPLVPEGSLTQDSAIKPRVIEALRGYLLALERGEAGNLVDEEKQLGDVTVRVHAETEAQSRLVKRIDPIPEHEGEREADISLSFSPFRMTVRGLLARLLLFLAR